MKPYNIILFIRRLIQQQGNCNNVMDELKWGNGFSCEACPLYEDVQLKCDHDNALRWAEIYYHEHVTAKLEALKNL